MAATLEPRMLGDYMNYNARPGEERESVREEDDAVPAADEWEGIATLADFEAGFQDEEGYDPYNHPIDRRFLK